MHTQQLPQGGTGSYQDVHLQLLALPSYAALALRLVASARD